MKEISQLPMSQTCFVTTTGTTPNYITATASTELAKGAIKSFGTKSEGPGFAHTGQGRAQLAGVRLGDVGPELPSAIDPSEHPVGPTNSRTNTSTRALTIDGTDLAEDCQKARGLSPGRAPLTEVGACASDRRQRQQMLKLGDLPCPTRPWILEDAHDPIGDAGVANADHEVDPPIPEIDLDLITGRQIGEAEDMRSIAESSGSPRPIPRPAQGLAGEAAEDELDETALDPAKDTSLHAGFEEIVLGGVEARVDSDDVVAKTTHSSRPPTTATEELKHDAALELSGAQRKLKGAHRPVRTAPSSLCDFIA